MRRPAARLTLSLMLALLAGAVACGSAEDTTPTPLPTTTASPIVDLDGVVISLERTPCFGACPVYKLTVYGHGTVVYEGKEFVGVEGNRTAAISLDEIRRLVREFESIDYFSLEDSYQDVMATDMPSVRTSITVDGRSKTIWHYHGDFRAPIELTRLEERIDEIVGTARWVERAGAAAPGG